MRVVLDANVLIAALSRIKRKERPMSTLTIELPEDVREELETMSRAEGVAAEEFIADWLKREVAVRRFRDLQSRMVPHAKAAGFESDEDFFKAIS